MEILCQIVATCTNGLDMVSWNPLLGLPGLPMLGKVTILYQAVLKQSDSFDMVSLSSLRLAQLAEV